MRWIIRSHQARETRRVRASGLPDSGSPNPKGPNHPNWPPRTTSCTRTNPCPNLAGTWRRRLPPMTSSMHIRSCSYMRPKVPIEPGGLRNCGNADASHSVIGSRCHCRGQTESTPAVALCVANSEPTHDCQHASASGTPICDLSGETAVDHQPKTCRGSAEAQVSSINRGNKR